jgi:YXWGXW repeat-containing protein
MKKKVVKLAFLLALVIGAGSYTNTASAQIYVSVRPEWHPVERPVAPSPRHVWIDEEWEARNGAYVAVGGHWAEPPHPGWIWVPGHWSHGDRGHYWHRGHWARR